MLASAGPYLKAYNINVLVPRYHTGIVIECSYVLIYNASNMGMQTFYAKHVQHALKLVHKDWHFGSGLQLVVIIAYSIHNWLKPLISACKQRGSYAVLLCLI